MKRLLLATNPAFYPSVGGSEMVLMKILNRVKNDFERIVVFAERQPGDPDEYNGIEIRNYNAKDLRRFAKSERPDVYFPNMVHNTMTFANIEYVSKYSGLTVLNMIGGYGPTTPLSHRQKCLEAASYADKVVHVDPLSVEYLVDRAISPTLPYCFITQGLNFSELESAVESAKSIKDDYFVYAHNLWSWKTPELYVREIAARLPEYKFVIIASDKTGDSIETISEMAEDIPNLELRLGLTRTEYLKTFAGAKAAISTSQIEGAQPNIMLEAGFLGVPYLSTCPGQNYGHYPHVEMYVTAQDIAGRLKSVGYNIKASKRECLDRAQAQFASQQYDWDDVTKRFRDLFVGGR